LAGRNSFSQGDLVNVGLDSGLESARSDYVTRLQVAPNRNFSFVSRGRFDHEDLSLNRLEVGASANLNPWLPLTTSVTYARYAAQPEIGYPERREGLLTSARWNVTENWFLSGSVLLDLDRYLAAREQFVLDFINNPETAVYRRQDALYPNRLTLGVGYVDECVTLNIDYSMTPREDSVSTGEKRRNQTLLLRLELRTLGEVSLRQSVGGNDETNQ
jgi:LPS-assembly protein